jgi:hypothetical protein
VKTKPELLKHYHDNKKSKDTVFGLSDACCMRE